MTFSTRLPHRLESHLGQQYNNKKLDKQVQDTLVNCPPVHPALLAHLRFKFQDPSKVAKPTNPQLAQLLTIQYGCDKVLNYLEQQYNRQSEAARTEREGS